MILAAPRRLRAAAWCQVGPEEDRTGDAGLSRRFSDLTFYLISVGTIALIGTSIRVWAGMDVIQTQIGALVKSDSSQDQRIERILTDINTLRVQVGILRAMAGNHQGMGRP